MHDLKNVREPLKQIAIWFGVIGLIPLSAWYGAATYSPPPDTKEYYKSTARFEEKIKEAEGQPEKEKLREERDRLAKDHEEAERVFYRDMFWVAYPVGLVALILGIFFPVQPVGSGAVIGGLSTLGTGCYSYWDKMEGWHRFASLVVVLFVLILLGAWRFWPLAPK